MGNPNPKQVAEAFAPTHVIYETTDERNARLAREKRGDERAAALEGLVFPLRVRALSDGSPRHASGRIVRVRKGEVFTVGRPEDYSHRWMKALPAETPDQVQATLDRAPKRPKRSGEGGNPETPSWQQDPKAAATVAVVKSKSV